MESGPLKLPLVVIVGPTASGKTLLAVELAQQFDGEIICADSRTVYKGMDIGTAKPSAEEQQSIPHWGLDLVEPSERFTAADFKKYAEQKIDEIRSRGRVPFLVGGTGLYVDAVLFDYQFGGEVDSVYREELEKMTVDELHAYCNNNNILLPENAKNKRYVIRAIEQKSISVKGKTAPISNSIIVGIATDKEQLRTRIAKRTEQLFENGVVDEATTLGKKYSWNSEAMTGNIYRIVKSYLEGEYTLDIAKEKNTTADWRLAKRQLTWLRRNEHIRWCSLTEAKMYVSEQLANE